MQDPEGLFAERDLIALVNQPVKDAAIGLRLEEVVESALDGADVVADHHLRPRAMPQVVGGRQVVGVGMGLQDPGQGQLLLLDRGEQGVG